jgi:hypothetical protein
MLCTVFLECKRRSKAYTEKYPRKRTNFMLSVSGHALYSFWNAREDQEHILRSIPEKELILCFQSLTMLCTVFGVQEVVKSIY